MAVFERNLASILCFIRQSSPVVKIALCTLPPLGEDLSSRANKMVREANEIIERVAKSDDVCSVLPVFDRLESMIEKGNRRKKRLPVEMSLILALIMMPMYHVCRMFNWNTLSSIVGHTVLTDGIHLNEKAADEIADLIVDWLLTVQVAKAIAVKR